MKTRISAALALLVGGPAAAQDLSTATPIAGSWAYAPTADGSEAAFANSAGSPQLWIHCARAKRRVTISRRAVAAAPSIDVWTSAQTRSVPPSFNPATGRLAIDLSSYDPLLDAMASSRGRLGFALGSQPSMVLPARPEIARVIEDCRT